ncbi:NADH-quinone oxidoreductase subunit NuoK [candidate division KSB1 bacterium]|nr:NADH-quinone oxidoreductase subunit NuoK [candidate division KSB1 bacterium]TDI83949.1 MAG: NADH-quinone oxidoreductase subunit NuoK [Caldithrix sp.]MCH7754666.1 NADH-quinone oxidoreductase subunit NuoK [candidate division KSB1 bacterium]MCH8020343.1 NADH-quinone oxidoreductase subunit NuoK [candidate division KSB1 bacterium]MCH8872878.1 NADH-quinone oxidoreductase subunit NuoK [candidate division KSB1 bacterium]
MTVGLEHYLVLSAALFSLGLLAVITKKNAVTVLMGIELILNAANINFVAFARFIDTDLDGQVFAIFVIVTAAASAAVALAIVLNLYEHLRSINLEEADSLAG